MSDSLTQSLADLLQRAGAAHGVYEHEKLNDVYDEQWAAWYGEWLVNNGFNDILHTTYNGATLGDWLQKINEELKAANTGEAWASFTARRLIEINSQ